MGTQDDSGRDAPGTGASRYIERARGDRAGGEGPRQGPGEFLADVPPPPPGWSEGDLHRAQPSTSDAGAPGGGHVGPDTSGDPAAPDDTRRPDSLVP